MNTESITVPTIIGSKQQETLNLAPIKDYKGQIMGHISLTSDNSMLDQLSRARTMGFEALQAMEIDEILDIYNEAARIFRKHVNMGGYEISLKEYAEYVTLATGLPINASLRAAKGLYLTMSRSGSERMIRASSPNGSLDVFDDLIFSRSGVPMGWAPKGRVVGSVLPSNHPAVTILAMMIPAMKVPVVMRASRKEPYTASRIVSSLVEAGLPEDSIQLVLTDTSGIDTFLRSADLGMIFGTLSNVERFSNMKHVKAYGPGRSKMAVLPNEDRKTAANILFESLTADAGRACINMSSVVLAPGAEGVLDYLLPMFYELEARDPLDQKSMIGALPSKVAHGMVEYVSKRMIGQHNLLEAGWENSIIEKEGSTFIMPQFYWVESDHNAFGDEYPFIFGTITNSEIENIPELMSHSLSAGVIGRDSWLERQLLLNSSIEKVYRGIPTNTIDPAQPHEGLMGDFLYSKKAWA